MKSRTINTTVMDVLSFDERGNLHLRAFGKIHKQFREIDHHFRVTPFEENLKALKPGVRVVVKIEILEE